MTPEPPPRPSPDDERTLDPEPWSGIPRAELVGLEDLDGRVRLSVRIPARDLTLEVPAVDLDEGSRRGTRSPSS